MFWTDQLVAVEVGIPLGFGLLHPLQFRVDPMADLRESRILPAWTSEEVFFFSLGAGDYRSYFG